MSTDSSRDCRQVSFALAPPEPPAGGPDATLISSLQSQIHGLETQLLSTQRMESLGFLAAGIAHDFNNLITPVLGYIELARAAVPPDSPVAEYCENGSKSLRRAAELARQLLAYAGRATLRIGPVNLSATVDDQGELLDAWFGGRGTLNRDLNANLPELTADAVQMAQLVMNLVANAADAVRGNRGTVTIRTRAEDCTPDTFHGCRPTEELPAGLYVLLQVSDTGGGIPVEIQSRLFEPFASSKDASHSPRGLGLSIVRGIVSRHHGTIRVESAPDRGTTFTVYLPTFTAPKPV